MSYDPILTQIYAELQQIPNPGKVADYIPELAKVSHDKLGAAIVDLRNNVCKVGDADERFSIQSISKVLLLSQAFILQGGKIWNRVGVEPSGNPFNSLVQLEYENGIPRNALINPGALVVCDILMQELNDPYTEYLQFVRKLADNQDVNYNISVAQSEIDTSHRNRALINLMKSFENIKNNVQKVLEFYCYICSIEMSTVELARTFTCFANDGVIPATGQRIMTANQSQRINAIMQTCGFYDEAGEFAFKVGLPGKSGVGGGIVAVNPHQYCVAVWSPPLNQKGNSYLGMKFLERLTTETDTSIF